MKPIKYSIQVLVPTSNVWSGYSTEKSWDLKEATNQMQGFTQQLVNTKVDHFLQVALVPHGWKLVKE